MPSEKVFNPVKRRVRRQNISGTEAATGLVVILALIAVGAWVAAQKHNFDPRERDLDIESLRGQDVSSTLYHQPPRRWADPAAAGNLPPGAPRDRDGLGIFPPEILDHGWRPAARPRTFTPATLYEKINGQAEQYLKFGFQELHFISLAKGPDTIDIYLFDQDSFANSLGVFAAQRSPGSKVAAAGAVRYLATEVGAIGMVDKFFFQIIGSGSSSQDKARQLLRTLAAGRTARAPGMAEAPGPFRVLREGLKLDFANISYQRLDVFQYDFARRFWFGRPEATAARRYFLHQAVSAKAARRLFQQIMGAQANEYDELEKSADRVWYRHKFLKTFFSLNRDGDMLFGVDNEPRRERAEAAVRELRKAMAHGRSGKAPATP